MVTMTERLERKVKRRKRHELLIEQTAVRENNCVGCEHSAKTTVKSCKGCPAFAQLTRIGDELTEMSQQSREQRERGTFEKIREFGLSKAMYRRLKDAYITDEVIIRETGMTRSALDYWKSQNLGKKKAEVLNLTVEQYKRYKAQGFRDEEIADKNQVKIQTLNKFKKENGLCGKKNKMPADTVFEFYIDNKLAATGTQEQLMKQFGLAQKTIRGYRTPSYIRIAKQRTNGRYIVVKEEQSW